MSAKIQISILAGIVGTAIMTMAMFIMPILGMPQMSPPDMLAGMLGLPIFAAWIIHFMIGIMFAFGYTFGSSCKLPIKNSYAKGAVYGTIVFVFAQIMTAIMGTMVPMWDMAGAMVPMVMGSLMGHTFFGVAVSKTVGDISCTTGR